MQGHVNHLGAFGDEDSLFWLQAMAQLSFSQCAEELHTRVVERFDFDDGHGYFFSSANCFSINRIFTVLASRSLCIS